MNEAQVIRPVVGLALLVAVVLAAGCAQSAHQTGQDVLDKIIPDELLAQVNQSISFADLQSSPDDYIGRTVLLGGNVIKAHRVKDRTEIEILQLPIMARMPSEQRSQSEGRFIAVQSGEFLDPAIIEPDSPLTIVGEVKGVVTKPFDESEYQYLVLEIKHLINWKELRSRERRPGYGGGYNSAGYWPYPYGPYGYDPWGYGPFYGPYGYGRGFYPHYYGGGFSSPAPAPAPPSAVPPRFQKN